MRGIVAMRRLDEAHVPLGEQVFERDLAGLELAGDLDHEEEVRFDQLAHPGPVDRAFVRGEHRQRRRALLALHAPSVLEVMRHETA